MKKKLLIITTLSSAIFFITPPLYAFNQSPFIAAGYYVGGNGPNDGLNHLLLISSDASKTKWSVANAANINRPDKSYNNCTTYNVTCIDNFCIVPAECEKNKNDMQSFILKSIDNGVSWQHKTIDNNPIAPKSNYIINVSCADNVCVAPITNINQDNNSPFSVITSNDHGETWTSKNVPDLVNKELLDKNINHVTCTAKSCIISVGNFIDEAQNISPAIAYSNNQGLTWSYVKDVIDFPKSNSPFAETSVSCADQYCVISGFFINQGYFKPVILTSKDNQGSTWQAINNLNLPDNYLARIDSSTCKHNYCLVGGQYVSADGSAHPFILKTNNGVDWTINTNLQGFPATRNAQIQSMTCNEDVCIAGGYYQSTKANPIPHLAPFIIVSHDQGVTWSWIDKIANAPKMTAADLYSIQCDNAVCTFAGDYVIDDEARWAYVAFITSYDNGATWTYTTSSAINHFPKKSYAHAIFSLGGGNVNQLYNKSKNRLTLFDRKVAK